MTDWIEKLPEPLMPVAVVASLWFGFNYVVLADRAIAKDQATVALPRCLETLDTFEVSRRLKPTGLGNALGMPQLDRLERMMIDQYRPQPLSAAEKNSRCACAALRASAKLRWDYAIHTATFRIVAPQTASALSDDAAAIVLTGVCGFLPKLRIGE